MEYNEFEKKLLSQLKNDDKECVNTVIQNEKLIQNYLQNTEKPVHIKSLVDGINDIISNKYVKFTFIEEVLKMESMRDVLAEFRESDVVIRVCQKDNSTALKWLMTMDINPFVSDSNGMISLMYAAKQKHLYFFVEYLVKGEGNEELVNIVDNNGENALFHAINVPEIFELLLKTKIDVNHRNNDKETVLYLSLRNELSSNLEHLFLHPDVDLRIADKAGKTPIMEVLEQENYAVVVKVLRKLRERARKSPGSVKLDINYRSEVSNESIMSILIKMYFQMCCRNNYRESIPGKMDLITALGYILGLVISYPGFDINMPIDEIDNTPIMFFLMIGDFVAANFIFSCCKDVDLGKKNKNGINYTKYN